MKNQIDTLKRFTDDNSLRPWMNEVQSQEGFLCATDCHIAVRCKGKKIDVSNKTDINLGNLFKGKGWVPIDRDKLQEFISKIPKNKVADMRECPDCDGDGEVECDFCDKYSDCKRCSGSGEINSKTEFYEEFESKVRIKGVVLNPDYLVKLLTIEGALSIDTSTAIFYAKIGEYEAVLMGMLDQDQVVEFEVTPVKLNDK